MGSPAAGSNPHSPSTLTSFAWIGIAGALVACLAVTVWLARRPAPPPGLADTYRMTYHNITFDIRSVGSLTEVTRDRKGNVHGQMTVRPPLYGTGPFSGTATSSKIRFEGASQGAYTGTVDARGVLSGTYTYGPQHGTWRATPPPTSDVATPGPSGWLPWWWWAPLLVLLVALAVMYLRSARRRRPRAA